MKSISRREQSILDRARDAAQDFDNRMFADMYLEGLRRKIVEDDDALYKFMGQLHEPPVDIETFIDDEEYMGGTDLTMWPEVRKAIIDINRDWWKGTKGNATREALLMGATGTGKCLARGTPVLMFDGSILPVEQVSVGDLLMGPDSTPRTVRSLARGREEMFTVTPKRGGGDPYTVNRSHILSLKITGMGSKSVTAGNGRIYASGDIVDISIDDYLNSSKTFKHVAKGWATGVEFSDELDLPVDPYFVGAWLGDGASSGVSIFNEDEELIEYLEEHARSRGLWLRTVAADGKCRRFDTTATLRGNPNSLLHDMHILGLGYGTKFIPTAYKTASRDSRLALLAGLVDTDGYRDVKGYEISTVLPTLRDDILYLARSLGFSATCTSRQAKDQNGNGQVAHRIFISGDLHEVPCKITRKRIAPSAKQKNVLLTGITVEAVGEGDYFGFEIDGDRRFLLGDFTVTHNTTICQVTTIYTIYLLGCITQPQTVYGLPKTTSIVIPIMAAKPHVTRKVVYQPIRKMIEDIPWFQKTMRMDKLIESEIYFAEKNIRVVVGGADADTILGEAVIGGVIDEINFMNVVLKSKKAEVTSGRVGVYDQAQSIYETMDRRKKSRFITQGPHIGVILVSSSTRYKGDFTDKRLAHVQKVGEKGVYVYNRKQYEVWPQNRYSGQTFRLLVGNEVLQDTRVLPPEEVVPEGALVLDVPIEYFDDFTKNPHDALRDIVGMSTSSISPFFRRRFKILDAISSGAEMGLESFLLKDNVILGMDGMPQVKRGHYCSNPSRPRYVHIDLSLTGDRCGIAMLRFDGLQQVERDGGMIEMLPTCSVEMAVSISPDSQNEIQLAEVRMWVKQLRDVYGYPIKVVTYDGFMSVESRQQWKKEGMKTGHVSVDKTSVPYKQFRDAISDGRIMLYQQDVLVTELFELEYDEGKDKVDHPVNGSKDVADAVCGAYSTLVERRSSWQGAASDDAAHHAGTRRAFDERYDEPRWS